MKKSLIAAVLTSSLIGSAFASCDATPYVTTAELQPACAEETPAVQGVDASPAEKLKVNQEVDSSNERNIDAGEKRASEKSSQGGMNN